MARTREKGGKSMGSLNWTKYVFFIACGLFLCLALTPALELLGMEMISKVIYIAGVILGAAGCLMPVGRIIGGCEEEQQKQSRTQ